MTRSKTDHGWDQLFASRPLAAELAKDGIALLSADEIKKVTNREPRLMTKFDTREYRPDPIKKADATLLPVKNGQYALVVGNGYADLPQAQALTGISSAIVRGFETLPLVCRSESQIIDVAHATGILQDFTGEKNLVLTIRGRLRTAPFAYTFDGARQHRLEVDGVQIEVDAGFEGERVYLVEAKMGARDNFIVRQLYYPYRMWLAQGVKKPIVPLFLTYSDQIFTLVEYRFRDPDVYGSIERVRTRAYRFDVIAETLDLASLMHKTRAVTEPLEIPFPQANDMRKVIDVVDAVYAGYTQRRAVTEFYEFADRQASYYVDAARYLGLLVTTRAGYSLTPEGVAFASSSPSDRLRRMASAMLERPVVRMAVERMLVRGTAPDRVELAELIAASRPELRGATLERRASSLAQWLSWLEASVG